MRCHKRLFLKLEKKKQCYVLKFCSINRNCLFRTKAREKETDHQKLRHPKISGPSRGKRSRSRYSKYLPGTYFSLYTQP